MEFTQVLAFTHFALEEMFQHCAIARDLIPIARHSFMVTANY